MTTLRAIIELFALALAAFFAFVGWHKSRDTIADLRHYGAWTVYLPEWLGRLVGWSEIGCAAMVLVGLIGLLPKSQRLIRRAALALIVNQVIASSVHLWHGENAALPQNALLIVMLLFVVWGTGAGSAQPSVQAEE